MNSPDSSDREIPYTDVQVEIEPEDSPRIDTGVTFGRAIENLRERYFALPVPARVAVAVVGAFITLSAVTAILRLVSAVLSVAIMGVILFLLYRFAVKPNAPR
jgi:hypothetical protein